MVWAVAAIVCVLDQLAKLWAVHALGETGRSITLIPHWLQLAYTTNRGGAAGLLNQYPLLLTSFSLVAMVVIVWWACSVPREEILARLGFGAILGGALGNMLDRLFRGGLVAGTYVVDFIDVHWHDRYHWPTFNVADSAICVGIAVVILAHLRTHRAVSACRGPSEKPSPEGGK